ncbi:hypothetical protein [Saccharothrix sp. Mg75]|uniref:hypothetical protein n=1 Tax=Saccharothrix sp. Mg75 TaxID=3445357 RepID=UPI003EEE89F2
MRTPVRVLAALLLPLTGCSVTFTPAFPSSTTSTTTPTTSTTSASPAPATVTVQAPAGLVGEWGPRIHDLSTGPADCAGPASRDISCALYLSRVFNAWAELNVVLAAQLDQVRYRPVEVELDRAMDAFTEFMPCSEGKGDQARCAELAAVVAGSPGTVDTALRDAEK